MIWREQNATEKDARFRKPETRIRCDHATFNSWKMNKTPVWSYLLKCVVKRVTLVLIHAWYSTVIND